MSKIEARRIVKKYGEALKKANYPFSAIYLFGSHAHGKAHKWSDIDVAVVSDKLKKNRESDRWKLWDVKLNVDLRIEPHGFTVKEFKNDINPMAYEIRKTGIRVL